MGAGYWSDIHDKPTCVYRLFDIEGRLLYVGLTKNPADRIPALRRKAWGREIASQTLEWFPERIAAKDAERTAIRDENPAHNITRPRMEGV